MTSYWITKMYNIFGYSRFPDYEYALQAYYCRKQTYDHMVTQLVNSIKEVVKVDMSESYLKLAREKQLAYIDAMVTRIMK